MRIQYPVQTLPNRFTSAQSSGTCLRKNGEKDKVYTPT
jgi:hypothetical protein